MDRTNRLVNRRIKNQQRVIAAAASLVCVFVFLVGGVNADPLYCDSCDNCQSKINSGTSGDVVKLNQSISASGRCIEWNKNNITFDC